MASLDTTEGYIELGASVLGTLEGTPTGTFENESCLVGMLDGAFVGTTDVRLLMTSDKKTRDTQCLFSDTKRRRK